MTAKHIEDSLPGTKTKDVTSSLVGLIRNVSHTRRLTLVVRSRRRAWSTQLEAPTAMSFSTTRIRSWSMCESLVHVKTKLTAQQTSQYAGDECLSDLRPRCKQPGYHLESDPQQNWPERNHRSSHQESHRGIGEERTDQEFQEYTRESRTLRYNRRPSADASNRLYHCSLLPSSSPIRSCWVVCGMMGTRSTTRRWWMGSASTSSPVSEKR